MDIKIGICSCPVGFSGAPCKHQAYNAKEFTISFQNLAPITSADSRHVYAVVAVGEGKAQPASFYTSIHQQQWELKEVKATESKTQDMSSSIGLTSEDKDSEEMHTSTASQQSHEDSDEHGVTDENMLSEFEDASEQQAEIEDENDTSIQEIKAELEVISADIITKLGTNDPQLTTGVLTLQFYFIISLADLTAGSGIRRRGVAIPVQPTALARRRPGLVCGHKMAQGRPPKAALKECTNKPQHLSLFKPKKAHNLALTMT